MQTFWYDICIGIQHKKKKKINLVFLKLDADGVKDEAGSGQGTNDILTLCHFGQQILDIAVELLC